MSGINLDRLPLAFCEGLRIKNAVSWNGRMIIQAGTMVTAPLIAKYRDISFSVPISVRIFSSTKDTLEIIRNNIQSTKIRMHQSGEGKFRIGNTTTHRYEEGHLVFRQGDSSNHDFFILVEGSVHILVDNIKVATITEPGKPIGEMSFLTGDPRSATVMAGKNCTLMRIPYAKKDEIIRSNPTVTQSLIETLVERLKLTTEQLVEAQSAK